MNDFSRNFNELLPEFAGSCRNLTAISGTRLILNVGWRPTRRQSHNSPSAALFATSCELSLSVISPRTEAASAGCRPWSFPRPRERRILVLTNSMGQLHGNDQKYMYHAVSQAYLRDAETVIRRANHTISDRLILLEHDPVLRTILERRSSWRSLIY